MHYGVGFYGNDEKVKNGTWKKKFGKGDRLAKRHKI
jgi:hypothetical protein